MAQIIKDLKIALKDLEPMVKDSRFLRVGKKIENFNLLPREAWANWLLCAVLRDYFQRDITFMEHEGYDGVIFDRDTGMWFLTEHVSALQVPTKEASIKGEARIINAIEKKIKRGTDYAKEKRLIVFIEDAEVWYPNKVGRHIDGKHSFDAVYCIGLVSVDHTAYVYSVTQFNAVHSPTWEVKINSDFIDYSVRQLQ